MGVLPPEQEQIDACRVPLEHVRGALDIYSISVFSLLRYMVGNGIPMDARIMANVCHDQPFLQFVWDPK
jgi:hypothetical protein